MKKFKDFWKSNFASNIAEERMGAREYQEMALEVRDQGKRNALRMMAQDEERHAEMLEDMETENQINTEIMRSSISKGTEGIDFGIYWNKDKKVWYVSQIGTGKNLYESRSESDARNWGKKNAQGGVFRPKKKSIIEKPGKSVHSAKWDRCVAHVKENGDGADPYAVCTAMLGDESFKSINDDAFMEKMDEYMTTLGIKLKQKTVNTSFAGETPNSLLARQDLETSKSIATFAVWYYDKTGNKQCATFNNKIDAESFAKDLMSIGCTKIEVLAKGHIESTGKKLEEEAEKAKEADTKSEVKSVVDNIKSIQLKRQSATILAREKSGNMKGKSFKDILNEGKK